MDRDCKTLNLDQCRTRADCGTRKKPKSEDLICVKKGVRAPKLEAAPALVRKASIVPKAPRMTVAHKAELRNDRPKLAFGKDGSLCAGMNVTDCSKAKTACHWIKEASDGTKAHCGRRGDTKYESMKDLRAFNARRYQEEVQAARELTPEEIRQARWAKAAASANANAATAAASRKGFAELCSGLKETDCMKPSVQMACKWSKASVDGKRKAYCSERTDSNLLSAATKKEMDKKFAELNKKQVSYGGKSDPVLRLFYGY